jgi:peptidoglycan/LPS O-acetylase OafA/YrhL
MQTPTITASTGSAPATARRERDRHLDALRAGCIGVVVLWHWVFTTVDWRGDGPHVGNPVPQIPLGWLLTWFIQPMPLFFLIGGHLHRRSLERAASPTAWIARRLRGLLAPALPLIGLFVAAIVAVGTWAPGHGYERALWLMVSPLWFLAVYVACVMIAPLGCAAHRRNPVLAPTVLALVAAGLDAARFGGRAGWWSWLSMIVVWALVHQLGIALWEPAVRSRRVAGLAAGGGYIVIAVAVALGPYAPEMVGVPGKPSNFSPATLVVAALAVAHLGLAALVRRALTRLVERRPVVDRSAQWLNARAMRVLVWHLPLWALAWAALAAIRFPVPADTTGLWWITRPVWLLVPGALLVLVLRSPRRRGGAPAGAYAERKASIMAPRQARSSSSPSSPVLPSRTTTRSSAGHTRIDCPS